MNDPFSWFFFGGAVILAGSIFFAQLRSRRKAQACQRALAARLGFEFIPAKGWTDSARITGTLRGKQVEFFNFTTGSGKSRKYWSAVSAASPKVSKLTFSFCRRGFVTKLRTLFGAKSIKTGDAAFDARWFVQTNQPEFFRAVLIPELRCSLDAVFNRVMKGDTLRQEAGVVRYAEQGSFNEERCARYEALLEPLCDLADVVELSASMG